MAEKKKKRRKLSGTVRLQSGETIRLDELPFFCEHAANRS